MDNPFTQYSVGRSIGLSVLGAACFTVISVVVWPFVALAMWATPEKDSFGKWEDRKNFKLTDREIKETDFNTPSDEEMEEMMKNPEFAEFVKSCRSGMPKAEPWPPEPGSWKLNRNKE